VDLFWLVAVAGLVLVPAVFLAGLAVVSTSSLRRANRVGLGRPATAAPLRWIWSPSHAAILHRRLRAACQLAGHVAGSAPRARRWPGRKAEPPADGITLLAREVLAQAGQVDHQVVIAASMARGLQRAQARVALDNQVRAVEDAALRVHRLAARSAQLACPTTPEALGLDQRIAAMEAALNDLTPQPRRGEPPQTATS